MELHRIIAARLHLLHRWRFPSLPEKLTDRAYTGRYSEFVAASWLRAHGFKVLRQNFRWGRRGEVDVVCRLGDTLVFVEVKSSTTHRHGQPGRHINYAKRILLRYGARKWLSLLKRPVPVRFDVVEVYLRAGQRPEVVHSPGAFTLYEGDAARAIMAAPGTDTTL